MEPGQSYQSNPKGAILYTGASGQSDWISVPEQTDMECCNALLFEMCKPTRGSGKLSTEGMCELFYTHQWMYGFNQNLVLDRIEL